MLMPARAGSGRLAYGSAQLLFLRKEQPSASRALPPVGSQSRVPQARHTTTVCEWLNTVVLRQRVGRGRGRGRGGEGPMRNSSPQVTPLAAQNG